MADTKQSTDSAIPGEVTELIGESQKIQGWIEKLTELQDETTPTVYEKVHTDYRARLVEVTSRLSEHRSDLSRTLDKRRAGVEKLRADRDEQAADLEEAKLRFAVGEYGSDEWDERREGVERGLQSLKDRLAAEDATLEELEAIFSSIPPEGGTPEGAKETAERPAKIVSAAADEAEAAEDAPAEKSEEAAAAARKARPQDETAKGSGETEGDDGEYLDELEFLESLSLEESDRFDAVSAMLDEEEGGEGSSK